MHFTTRQDIEAPLDFVHANLTDFEQFERMAMRRGAEVERLDRPRDAQPGWRVGFDYRGKRRNLVLRLVEVQPERQLLYALESASLEGRVKVELLGLTQRRTRLTVTTEVRPRTLTARLILQSMRLARQRLQKRIDVASGRLAGLIEERWRAEQRKRG